MSAAAIALVLVSALVHAWWNRDVHRSVDRTAVMGISYLVGGVALAPWAVVDPPVEALVWAVMSVVLHSAYQLLLAATYGQGALAVTYPIARGIAPLLVALGGWLLLDQDPSAPAALGIASVSIGLFVLARLGHDRAEVSAVVLAVGTGLAITGYTLADARAVQEVSPTGYLALVGVAAGAVVLLLARPGADRLKASLGAGTRVGALQIGSYLLVLFALQRAQAAQVASFRQLSVVFGVILAGEAVRRRTYVAAAFVAVGAVLIAS